MTQKYRKEGISQNKFQLLSKGGGGTVYLKPTPTSAPGYMKMYFFIVKLLTN